MPDPHPDVLAALRRLAAPIEIGAPVLPFGDARIDAHLPGGGLPIGQLHEVAADGIEAETGAVAAGFAACLAGALARLAPAGVLIWIAMRCDLYAPGLLPYGIDPSRLILVRTEADNETLGAMETALRSGAAAVVLGEVGRLSRLAARRLQLACLRGSNQGGGSNQSGGSSKAEGSTGFVLRRWPHGRRAAAPEGNAAATRWRVRAAPSALSRHATGPPCWQVTLEHARGGRPGAWLLQRSPSLEATSLEALSPGHTEADDFVWEPSKEAHDTRPFQPAHPLPAHRLPAHRLRVVAVLGDDAAGARAREGRRAAG